MALSSQLSLVVTFIFGICTIPSILEVDGHILVYRRLTNQLIEEYNDMPAQFGPSLSTNGIKVFGIPVQPHEEGCGTITAPPKSFYPTNAKFAAIIKRGGVDCTFEFKIRNAQAARFDAVVIYNNESDDLEHMSAQNSSGILIPSVFVGRTTGINLKTFFTPEIILVINDELPFNINTQLILPFSILIGLCFLIMIFYMIYKCIREERRLRRYRLPKGMLKKLPIIKFTKNSDLAYDTCVICLDEFAEGDKLRVLPCKHPYHSDCIDVWLTENKRECPICKRRVFPKSETRSQRNRQSSLDSITDTDDDTTPLLQQQPTTNSSINSTISTSTSTVPSTTSHGTFRRNNGSNVEAAIDVTSDDENMLSAARRVNPFDRSPNLPPHLAAQLNNERRTRSIWSWPVMRLFRRPLTISVAAPPYLEDTLNDVLAEQLSSAVDIAVQVANTTTASRAPHSSNNVLNPNLSGSFKDDEDDDAPLQCIYEPTAVLATTIAASSTVKSTAATAIKAISSRQRPVLGTDANNATNEIDSDFFQTPTQGGIAVAALPPNNNNNNINDINTNSTTYW